MTRAQLAAQIQEASLALSAAVSQADALRAAEQLRYLAWHAERFARILPAENALALLPANEGEF